LNVSGDKEAEGNFEVPDSRVVEFGTVSTGKRRLSQGNIVTYSGLTSGRIMAFYLRKLVNYGLFINS
jgi:hypothetical protein